MSVSVKPSAMRAVTKGLQTFLMANVPSVESVHDNWPAPNQPLVYPAITIFTKTPNYTPVSPYVIARGTPTAEDHSVLITRVVGNYDFSMQLDVWCAYKSHRESLHEEILEAFNLGVVPGIDLQLTDYFNQYAHFSLGNVEYLESGEGSERNEWRLLIQVLASTRAVNQISSTLMETIENTLEIPGAIAEPEGDEANLII